MRIVAAAAGRPSAWNRLKEVVSEGPLVTLAPAEGIESGDSRTAAEPPSMEASTLEQEKDPGAGDPATTVSETNNDSSGSEEANNSADTDTPSPLAENSAVKEKPHMDDESGSTAEQDVEASTSDSVEPASKRGGAEGTIKVAKSDVEHDMKADVSDAEPAVKIDGDPNEAACSAGEA